MYISVVFCFFLNIHVWKNKTFLFFVIEAVYLHMHTKSVKNTCTQNQSKTHAHKITHSVQSIMSKWNAFIMRGPHALVVATVERHLDLIHRVQLMLY